ncbi:hypothetical protein [Actinotalea sp.]|uniref:hypothetical protein n=1 Tax=Actinotalea sp. TaxID=1872145 RepID=UPI002B94883B|nr:hypothetical protein [Actinotalea sp.]HQY33978.1 hypothetical protein [Actinotalea sp.]HRA50675.1 hypothetical protein [Actinotalea sp.]
MALLRRAPHLPDEVRDRLDLAGDRPLAVGRLADGWAVATRTGLRVAVGEHVLARPWCDVNAARLDAEAVTLTVTWVDGATETVLHLADDAPALPRAVHDRVQSSVVHGEQVTVPDGQSARVVLRRAADGSLFTQVIGTGGVDLADPAVGAAVDAAEARVREAAGL